ncbi:type II toxin-antitoxin system PemK/MazF family toxin [Algoriphagus sp.]|uniref:type II toxin-antitoxin system PemK/MazF family toxin n=1 Tax=Algoriphagus sp. TaxID=1872435 RepID=UPI00271E8B8F|nr:type II toxin-antitoxin system PemK/MazF family toxin [Algoriphagus sp.]MDO8965454.1 type II toxin-antitoxin system PemK/MazF family toxin [Algoriphagus sp.]MDP3201493.1 type II toxin-antitoxin system PemK/MazF family toxin [Algoriphagus sp.]
MSDLNPVIGSEQAGRRPVVILSGNLMNKFLQVVITAPLTSKIKNYQGNPILKPSTLNGLKLESELMVFHIRSISKDRLIEKIGEVSKEELKTALATLNDITTL